MNVPQRDVEALERERVAAQGAYSRISILPEETLVEAPDLPDRSVAAGKLLLELLPGSVQDAGLDSYLKRLCAPVVGGVHSKPTGSVRPVLADDETSSPPAILHLVDAHASPPFWIRVLRHGANRTTAPENRRRRTSLPVRRSPADGVELGSGFDDVQSGQFVNGAAGLPR